MNNRPFIVKINKRIYLLRKDIYDYSTFNPNPNITNEILYNVLKHPIKLINNNKLDTNLYVNVININETHQYFYNNTYNFFRGINLINKNKQYVVIEILNSDFIINGKILEISYFHKLIYQHSSQKHVINKSYINMSSLKNSKIIKILVNSPKINYIEIIYVDINNNSKKYVIIPNIIYTNNSDYINYVIGNFNNFIIEKPNYIIKDKSEKIYTHTLITLELSFFNKTILNNTTNTLNQNIKDIRKLSTTLKSNNNILNELTYITKIINENTNNTFKNTYIEIKKLNTIMYTSSIIINETSSFN